MPMASIALYDIDFWFGGKQLPNLELMKVFNYYYSLNNRVIFARPNQDLGYFNKIFYFYENTLRPLPRDLVIPKENSKCYGCGFYKNFKPLISPIDKSPPSFLPYDLEEDNFKDFASYKRIKRASLIRVENMDLTNFKSDKKSIYIADHNLLYQKNFLDFANEYSNYSFYPYYDLNIYSEDKFREVERYSRNFKNRRLNLLFPYTKDFLEEFEGNYLYNFGDLTTTIGQLNCIKTILYLKAIDKYHFFSTFQKIPEIIQPILKWYQDKEQISYFSYIQDKPKLLKHFNKYFLKNSDFRLLLKQNPKTINKLTFSLRNDII